MYKYVLLFLLFCAIASGMSNKSKTGCNCQCNLSEVKEVCAQDKATKVMETFQNECMLKCFACTMNKNYVILFRTACDAASKPDRSPKSKSSKKSSKY